MRKKYNSILTFGRFFSLLLCIANSFATEIKTEPEHGIFIDAALKDSHILKAAAEADESASLHLFSHGRAGELFLKGKWRNAQEIVEFIRVQFSKSTTPYPYLNIYGCEFAKGEKGKQAVAYLEKDLNMKVSASTNITGKDGDWVLETGQVANSPTLPNYPYSLQDFDGDGVNDDVDIDDDNDGIPDAIESPSCYYIEDEAEVITSVTTELTIIEGSINNVFDNDISTVLRFAVCTH